MSIQKSITSNNFKKIFAYINHKNPIKVTAEIFTRIKHHPLNVYYRYKYKIFPFHPAFERYYEHPPLRYCLFRSARLYHWLHHPDVINQKPFVIEPNDHPFAPAIEYEPEKNLQKKEDVLKLYQTAQCKKILVESSGQMELFKYYFPEILSKCEIIRLGAIPRVSIDEIKSKNTQNLTFLCLASDFVLKGVDLIIDSWCALKSKDNIKLILCCPNVPESYRKKISAEKTIILNTKAPLNESEKHQLHLQAHVVLAPLHIDGGGNVIEAMEYGLPIITFRCQRSADQVMNKNGFIVDVPFYYYDTEGWGIRWKTKEEFLKILENSKKNGGFSKTLEELTSHYQFFQKNPTAAIEMGVKSLLLAENEFSLKNRNTKLLIIYKTALS